MEKGRAVGTLSCVLTFSNIRVSQTFIEPQRYSCLHPYTPFLPVLYSFFPSPLHPRMVYLLHGEYPPVTQNVQVARPKR